MNLAYVSIAAFAMIVWSMMSRFISGVIPGFSRAQGIFALITGMLVGLFIILTATSLPDKKPERKTMLYALAAGATVALIAFSIAAMFNGTGNASIGLGVDAFRVDIPVLLGAITMVGAYVLMNSRGTTSTAQGQAEAAPVE
jgi:hypothetical protein